ncbi:hypothetical protein Fmac_001916 [Flemingia macrophylla]|uniref:Protein SET n=1 Tax=Flemingia macrophylla TaxID=520843 RepID=A0ABD1NIK3_9FABA
MVDNRSKKLKVEENLEEEYIDEELILSFEKFQEVQEELAEINEKQSNEVLKVEQQYHEIRKTIYDKRNQIIKTLPNFWLKAFMSHPVLNDILNHEERENFNPNPYFENEKLTKAFTILEDGTTKITTTPIKWKEGKLTCEQEDDEEDEDTNDEIVGDYQYSPELIHLVLEEERERKNR